MKASSGLAALLVAGVVAGGVRAHADEAPKEHSMTGCLAKGDGGTFKLTNVDQGPTVVIAETTANLAPHLGHKVEITGITVPGKDNAHTMKVTALKMISVKCP